MPLPASTPPAPSESQPSASQPRKPRRTAWKPSWDLSTVPQPLILAEAGRRRSALRSDKPRRPKKLAPCPDCGVLCGARDLRRPCAFHATLPPAAA